MQQHRENGESLARWRISVDAVPHLTKQRQLLTVNTILSDIQRFMCNDTWPGASDIHLYVRIRRAATETLVNQKDKWELN